MKEKRRKKSFLLIPTPLTLMTKKQKLDNETDVVGEYYNFSEQFFQWIQI